MDRIFVEFADGSWLTTDCGSSFQADLAEMVARSGRPVLVEFRAAGEGYAPNTPCEDCGKDFAQCRCDGYDPDPPKEPSFLNALHDFYVAEFGHLLEDDDRSAAEKGTWSAIDSWNED